MQYGFTKEEIADRVSDVIGEKFNQFAAAGERDPINMLSGVIGTVIGAFSAALEENNKKLVEDLRSAGALK
ncbi:MAG TPA: hypothetical protein V6D05_10310 [Stenomitos sp.]